MMEFQQPGEGNAYEKMLMGKHKNGVIRTYVVNMGLRNGTYFQGRESADGTYITALDGRMYANYFGAVSVFDPKYC